MTIAVPAKLGEVLDTPEGLQLLSELLDYERVRGRQAILAALHHFDSGEVQRLLSLQLSALGAARFAREIAVPLVREIGERWANGQMGIAREHLASSVLRSLLGSALLCSICSATMVCAGPGMGGPLQTVAICVRVALLSLCVSLCLSLSLCVSLSVSLRT